MRYLTTPLAPPTPLWARIRWLFKHRRGFQHGRRFTLPSVATQSGLKTQQLVTKHSLAILIGVRNTAVGYQALRDNIDGSG